MIIILIILLYKIGGRDLFNSTCLEEILYPYFSRSKCSFHLVDLSDPSDPSEVRLQAQQFAESLSVHTLRPVAPRELVTAVRV